MKPIIYGVTAANIVWDFLACLVICPLVYIVDGSQDFRYFWEESCEEWGRQWDSAVREAGTY